MLFDWLIFFVLLLSIGFIFLVLLVIEILFDVLSGYFGCFILEIFLFIIKVVFVVLFIVVVSVLFILLFCYLFDVCLKWWDIIVGVFLIIVFFGIGCYGISFYIE